MIHLEYTFSGSKDDSTTEILIAVLNEAGYSGFLEKESLLIAYIPETDQDEIFLSELLKSYKQQIGLVKYTCAAIPETNWNAEWESNFDPVAVKDKVYIRTGFHPPDKSCEYELIIEPKMSFGTGHHETTRLMVQSMLSLDFEKQLVLDMGCGTGVLGILASKLGAENILGIDIDEWACRNSIENAEVNSCENLVIKQGDAGELTGMQFDIILANINRNILLNDMGAYSDTMLPGSILIISGILVRDEEAIVEKARQHGLICKSQLMENNWLSIIFEKGKGI